MRWREPRLDPVQGLARPLFSPPDGAALHVVVAGAARWAAGTSDQPGAEGQAGQAGAYEDLGADYFDRRTDPEREAQRLIARMDALGKRVTLDDAA